MKLIQGSYYLLAGLILLMSLSCVEIIEIENSDEGFEPMLVVEGLIHDGPGPYNFRFFYTGFRGQNVFSPFDPIEAFVRDDEGKEEFLVPSQNGNYVLPGQQIRGEVGRTYTLHFLSPEGDSYQSTPERLQSTSKIDSVYYELNYEEVENSVNQFRFRQNLRTYIDTDLSGFEEAPFFRWDYQHWYRFTEPLQPDNPLFVPKTCYVLDDSYKTQVLLLDGRESNGDRWLGQPVSITEADWRFYESSVFVIVQYSLSEGAFRYWSKVDRVANQTGDIFDSPPAIVRGNIQNLSDPNVEVLGYFQVSATDTAFLRLSRLDLNLTLLPFCNLPVAAFLVPSGNPCENCLDIPGSFVERPSFW